MRKLIITAALTIVLGIPDKAIASSNQIPHDNTKIQQKNVKPQFNFNDLSDEQLIRALHDEKFRNTIMYGPQIGGGYLGNNEYHPTSEQQQPTLQNSPIQESNTNQNSNNLERIIERIHNSITGNRTKSTPKRQDDGSLLFLNPEHIYDQNKQNEKVQIILKQIMQDEYQHHDTFENTNDARAFIDTRSQYAAVIDKVVALQTFKATENRFEQIAKILTDIDEIQDLKGIAELQVRMKGMLAVIQNEATKLQMVAHLRNTERELINQQKQQRNMKILNSKNTAMPPIRSIR
ncbi:type IV secretion system protein [Bartonella henselae]|uniref:type IV secretion system protein n=1 Tax=Bartonella henselae TaxID=38323 RepID=UPI000A7B471B|nr:type IV secretion system protein [Bartonella henselae]